MSTLSARAPALTGAPGALAWSATAASEDRVELPELVLLPPPAPRRAARHRRAAARAAEGDQAALLARLEVAWAELSRAHRHLRALLDCVGEGVLGVDGDGTVTFANAAAGSLLGRDPADLVGARAADLAAAPSHPECGVDGAPSASQRRGPGEPGYAASDTFRRADGGGVPVEWRCSALEDGSRVLVFRDARERAAVARERRALRAWATAPRARGAAPARGAGRVLFVEAEPLLRAAVGERLPTHGWEPTLVADACAALRIAREEAAAGRSFDAIVVDLTLVRPDATERHAHDALRAAHPTARILASSGCANDPAMLDHAAYGFDAVLVKPYTIERFVRALGSPA